MKCELDAQLIDGEVACEEQKNKKYCELKGKLLFWKIFNFPREAFADRIIDRFDANGSHLRSGRRRLRRLLPPLGAS